MAEHVCETCANHHCIVFRAMGATVRTCGCGVKPDAERDVNAIADAHYRGCIKPENERTECKWWEAAQ